MTPSLPPALLDRLEKRGWREDRSFQGHPIQTPLMVALVARDDKDQGDPDLALALLDAGMDAHEKDYGGGNILWYCFRHPDLIRVMVEAGADPCQTDDSGETVLFELFRKAHCDGWDLPRLEPVVTAFLAAGVDPGLGVTEEGEDLAAFVMTLGRGDSVCLQALVRAMETRALQQTLAQLPAAPGRCHRRL